MNPAQQLQACIEELLMADRARLPIASLLLKQHIGGITNAMVAAAATPAPAAGAQAPTEEASAKPARGGKSGVRGES